MKSIRVEIEDALHARVKSTASLSGKTLRQFVLDVLSEAVKENK